eukprot:evm.model.scf_1938.1 EVM.evm.TU.scf_1938.1   scf_1938:3396-5531(-)
MPRESDAKAGGSRPPKGRSKEGDAAQAARNALRQPGSTGGKHKGGQQPSAGSSSSGMKGGAAERESSSSVAQNSALNSTNAPVKDEEEAATSRSDAGAGVRLFPRYGSKLPVSPRRAQSMSADPSKPETAGSAADGHGAAGSSTGVRVNRHVASIGGTASPKGESWDQRGRKAQGRNQVGPKQGGSPQKKRAAGRHPAPKVIVPPKPKALDAGAAKPGHRTAESFGAAFAKKDKRSTTRARKGGAAREVAVEAGDGGVGGAPAPERNRSQGAASGLPQVTPSDSPAMEPHPPAKVGRTGFASPGTASSDSDIADELERSHSPKVVHATALSHRSSDRETPRSSMPRTAQAGSHIGSGKWTISTPINDGTAETYARRRRGTTMTSMEQEVADAPQSARPFSPTQTVSDAFNMHFDSRGNQRWLVDEDRPRLGLDPSIASWDFPFGRPRRNSNPKSEVSGMSEYSGYEARDSESDMRSRSNSLGLGRFGGQGMPQLTTDAWYDGRFGSRAPNSAAQDAEQGNHLGPKLKRKSLRGPGAARNGDPKFLNAGDAGSGWLNGGKMGSQAAATSVLSCHQLQVHQDILQSPKGHSPRVSPRNGDAGQTGSDMMLSWGGDVGQDGGRSAGVKHRGRSLERFADQPPRGGQSAYGQRTGIGRADDSECDFEGEDGRRGSFGGKVLQFAVFAVAGVAAIVFGGELIKAAVNEEEDKDRGS